MTDSSKHRSPTAFGEGRSITKSKGGTATPHRKSIFFRARVALGNVGVFLPERLTINVLLSTINKYEGKPKPMGLHLMDATQAVLSWVEAQENKPPPEPARITRGELKQALGDRSPVVELRFRRTG